MSDRVRIEPAPHIRVALGDTVVADSAHGYVVFEQGLPPRYYVPRADVKAELAPGTGAGTCPWKGEWKHLDVVVGGQQGRERRMDLLREQARDRADARHDRVLRHQVRCGCLSTNKF